ncbi:NAD(P)-binding protein [Exidia glandulosa HHB12029]|uniref:NAD(P)-binding protein n=1 Tax=Exidia glandulosa HHB12029 TaxID=1314781 RepID=A0A165JCA6_EXIGL|nr:NAD(P)-binding protein [Exidia glandulosa HHB12029]
MPAVSAPAKVLVTGATGYIAAHVVHAYLAAGFSVIGTVRSAPRGDYLVNLFNAEFPGKFEYALVSDIEAAGALDDLARQVDVIAHTASPVNQPAGDFDPQVLIGPALNGTKNVLKSAAVQGSKVKRVVITGSVVSVFRSAPPGYAFTERDWNDEAVGLVESQGKSAPGVLKYIASKVLAERAAWAFLEETTPKPKFDIVHVLPSYVYGPIISDVKKVDELPFSFARLYEYLAFPEKTASIPPGSFVDVRDVGRIHVDASTRQDVAGRRLIAASPVPLTVQDFYDAYYNLPESLRAKLPFNVPRGTPGSGDAERGELLRFSDESQKTLGWELRTFEETVRDSLQGLVDRHIL